MFEDIMFEDRIPDPVSKFKIGDDVQTNEEYSEMVKRHNSCVTKEKHKFLQSIKGKVTEIKIQNIYKTHTTRCGAISLDPFRIEDKKILIILDTNGRGLSETYFERVNNA